MRLVSLLGHCCEVLEKILEQPRRPADIFLSRYFRERKYLGSRDRRFIADHVYGTLRNSLRYQFLFSRDKELQSAHVKSLTEPLVGFALEQGIDEVGMLSESCSIMPKRVEEIDGILQNASALIASLNEPVRSAVRYSLPGWFATKLIAQYGDRGQVLMASLHDQSPTTIRVNRFKTTQNHLAQALLDHEVASRPCTYAPDGLVLERRVNINGLLEFKKGMFEVQDEGSQLLSIAFDPKPEWRVFDACAGGGGKTLHIADLMEGKGEVVAHDVNPNRLKSLTPRLERSGLSNVKLMPHSQYLSQRSTLEASFDGVFIDAPCTGTGTLRRNPGMRLTLDEVRLQEAVQLQQNVLQEYASLVKPGGVLFYGTCSLLREENQEQIEWFLQENVEWCAVPINLKELIPTEADTFQVLPNSHNCDGFFGAMLQRQ